MGWDGQEQPCEDQSHETMEDQEQADDRWALFAP